MPADRRIGPLKILLPSRGPQKEVLLIGPDHWSYKAPGMADLSGSVWDLVRATVVVSGDGGGTVAVEGAQDTQLVIKYANYEGGYGCGCTPVPLAAVIAAVWWWPVA